MNIKKREEIINNLIQELEPHLAAPKMSIVFKERLIQSFEEQKDKIIEETVNELSKYGISAPDTKALVLNAPQFEAILKNKLKQV
ncbi:MAG: hypothetical protein ACOCQR_03330 [bacterium]